MYLINLFLLLYAKCLSTVSPMYLVFHQQLFHMHLLSFQLLLFLVMSCLALLHFVLLFLRTLKCQTTKSISHAKLSHLKFSKISNSSESVLQKCLKICKTWYLHMVITIRPKKKGFHRNVFGFLSGGIVGYVMRMATTCLTMTGYFCYTNIATDRLIKCGSIDPSKDNC